MGATKRETTPFLSSLLLTQLHPARIRKKTISFQSAIDSYLIENCSSATPFSKTKTPMKTLRTRLAKKRALRRQFRTFTAGWSWRNPLENANKPLSKVTKIRTS